MVEALSFSTRLSVIFAVLMGEVTWNNVVYYDRIGDRCGRDGW